MKPMIMLLVFSFAAVLGLAGCAKTGSMQKESATVSTVISGGQSSSSAMSTADDMSGQTYQVITADEAKEMMDKGGVTIVDVRRQEEYDAGHIKDAILIPNESIGDTAPAELTDKDAVILVYCRTGIRAKDASQKLADLGYTNIYDIGGIVDWPYETVK